jgi:hypothetical protein
VQAECQYFPSPSTFTLVGKLECFAISLTALLWHRTGQLNWSKFRHCRPQIKNEGVDNEPTPSRIVESAHFAAALQRYKFGLISVMIGAANDRNLKSNKDEIDDSQCRGATLVGLRADPGSSPEDWESDFDFDSSTSILPPPAATRSGNDPSPSGSSPRAAITVSERRDLEELLKTLPAYPNLPQKSQLQNVPTVGKLGIKDLLRETQHTCLTPDPLFDIQVSRTDSPKAGCVESHEWNLALARGKKNLQVFKFHFFLWLN